MALEESDRLARKAYAVERNRLSREARARWVESAQAVSNRQVKRSAIRRGFGGSMVSRLKVGRGDPEGPG
jgi:hypothetical protein